MSDDAVTTAMTAPPTPKPAFRTRHHLRLLMYVPARTYSLVVIERHIRDDVDRECGVRDVPFGQADGDIDLIRYAADRICAAVNPDLIYEVAFYEHGDPFGSNDFTLILDHIPGRRLRYALFPIIDGEPAAQPVAPDATPSTRLLDQYHLVDTARPFLAARRNTTKES